MQKSISFNFNSTFNSKHASAGIIAAFLILTFVFISGVSSIVIYQSNVAQAHQDITEQQNQLIREIQTNFNITQTSYNESGQIVTAIIENVGEFAIETNKLSYFINDTYLTNITPRAVNDNSKQVRLLQPNEQMQISFSFFIPQDTQIPLEIIHDTDIRDIEIIALPYFIGEVGSFTTQNNQNIIINFTQNSYSQPPAIFMTPKTENSGGEDPFAPIIHSINTTHANVSLCQDSGLSTCDTTYLTEEVSYLAFDINRTNDYSWIEVGFVNAPTDGSTTSITFSETFTNIPYMFAQPQTYNINGVVSNGIGAHAWFASATTTGAGIIGCDHPGTGNSCSGTATENFAYLAIDIQEQDLSSVELGTEDIAASAWTPISFTQSYTNPQILVMQNSDNGGEDPQYPWARLVSSTDAQIRYCEADAGGVCNAHTDETVRWLSIEDGLIEVTSGPP